LRTDFNFPGTLTGKVTDVYSDPNSGKLLLFDSSGTYTIATATELVAVCIQEVIWAIVLARVAAKI